MTEHFSSLRKKCGEIISTFSPREYTTFRILVAVFIVGLVGTAWSINEMFLVEVPARGGTLSEGVIGAPRFINPLLAVSDADRDLTTLVYAGLMRPRADGTLTPHLAERYEISDDGLTYTFTLRDNIFFHDGEPITAEDVVFTTTKAQDPALKSPRRASWEGVSIEAVDSRTVVFTLGQPYAPFLENTTIGILPEHIWRGADPEQFSFSQFNISPVGSGPYRVKSIKRNSSGVPSHYELAPFAKFPHEGPYISRIRISFFTNEEALVEAFRSGKVDAINAISPRIARDLAKAGNTPISSSLPRTFAVFFNQNEAPLFTDKSVRVALEKAVDRERIIEEILSGYGTALEGPIPPGALGYSPTNNRQPTTDNLPPTAGDEQKDENVTGTSTPTRIEEAQAILERNGWEFDEEALVYVDSDGTELSFSLSTSNVTELKEVGLLLKEQWEELGARVELRVFEAGDLNQNVIRPRNYQSLLFGEIIGRDSDLFAFWHSSQRNDPGLNIALYANITADNLLEETRTISDIATRIEKYRAFEEEIEHDVPAVFLYAPDFIYFVPSELKGVEVGAIATPNERFLNVHEWYIETDKVWRTFVSK